MVSLVINSSRKLLAHLTSSFCLPTFWCQRQETSQSNPYLNRATYSLIYRNLKRSHLACVTTPCLLRSYSVSLRFQLISMLQSWLYCTDYSNVNALIKAHLQIMKVPQRCVATFLPLASCYLCIFAFVQVTATTAYVFYYELIPIPKHPLSCRSGASALESSSPDKDVLRTRSIFFSEQGTLADCDYL